MAGGMEVAQEVAKVLAEAHEDAGALKRGALAVGLPMRRTRRTAVDISATPDPYIHEQHICIHHRERWLWNQSSERQCHCSHHTGTWRA